MTTPELNRISEVGAYVEIIERSVSTGEAKGSDERKVAIHNLYREAVREAKRLQAGKDDIQSISAAVRNVFELHLIINKLEQSEDAVKHWIGQLQNDALEIHDGIIALVSKEGLNHDAFTASKARILKSGETHGVVPCRPFRIKDIAAEFGWTEAYDAMYKLCSKIVHPSSIRVNLPGAFDQNDDYKNTLIHVGVHHMALIAAQSQREFA
jgi:hypothetical protein